MLWKKEKGDRTACKWLTVGIDYMKKNQFVLYSAYTVSGIRLQHRKLDFGMKLKNLNEQVNIYRHIYFNSQVNDEIFTVEKSLGMD